MNDKINLDYFKSYADTFSQKVCGEYFGTKKYMTGQEIIQLTPCTQVNFMVIKALFEKWQEELQKLMDNPFFDYRDMSVKEALNEFMNVLSRAIKVERAHFEPLLKEAVLDTVILAMDPLVYMLGEIEKAAPENPTLHLRSSKKYIKWHRPLWDRVLENTGRDASVEALKGELGRQFDQMQPQLEAGEELLKSFDRVLPVDWEAIEQEGERKIEEDHESEENLQETHQYKETAEVGAAGSLHIGAAGSQAIDPALAWARFESEQSGLLKGPISKMEEGVAINQRFMFTKKLFEGNPDLMSHAFTSIDKCDSFVEAIELINQRFVAELGWDKDSEEVHEFLHLVYRKFDEQ